MSAKTAALVMTDLREGTLPFIGGPHTVYDVVTRATQLAERFRAHGSPVVMVRVGWSDDYAEVLKQLVDAQIPTKALPEDWWHHPVALGKCASGIGVVRHQWGTFYGTDLEPQLRRRGADTIILCRISTDIGAGSTAQSAWELGFNPIIAEDACSAASTEQYQASMTHIPPRIVRIRSVEEILQAL